MDVRQIADLAKLALTREEEERMQAELETILGFVQQMQGCEAAHAGVGQTQNALRADVVRPSMARAVLLEMAPSAAEEYLSVPKTID